MGIQPVSEGLTGRPWYSWEPATNPGEGPSTHNLMELPDATAPQVPSHTEHTALCW